MSPFSFWILSRPSLRANTSIVWNEPATAEEEAGAERREENRLALAALSFRGGLQAGVECRAAHGRAEIAGSLRDGRKQFWGNAALFCEESNETRIRLMGGKTADGGSRNSAAQLHGGEDFFQARDGGTGKRFAVKLHFEASIIGIGHMNRRSVLACAAK